MRQAVFKGPGVRLLGGDVGAPSADGADRAGVHVKVLADAEQGFACGTAGLDLFNLSVAHPACSAATPHRIDLDWWPASYTLHYVPDRVWVGVGDSTNRIVVVTLDSKVPNSVFPDQGNTCAGHGCFREWWVSARRVQAEG